MKKVLVTGSSGSLASRLIDMLLERGIKVRGTDIVNNTNEKIEFVKGDLRKLDDVMKACEGVDTVFHVGAALYQAPHQLAVEVNVLGTKNIIEACRRQGVKRLVYTSSSSVVFSGHHIVDGTEDLPYAKPSFWFTDSYVQTKATAERLVREANGNGLLTVSIRPHMIFGPHDKYVFPTIADKGASLIARMGSGTQLVSVSYVDNVAHAHLLAADALCDPNKAKIVAGQVYNINDGKKVNFFTDIAYRIASEVGGHKRSLMGLIPIPFFILYILAFIAELFTRPFGIDISLNRLAITLICSNRSFSIAKAERELGYKPIVPFEEGFERTLASVRVTYEEMKRAKKANKRPALSYWLFFVASLSLLGVVQAMLSPDYLRVSQFMYIPDQITPFAMRVFAYWTLINVIIRYALAIAPYNKTLFRVGYLTFVASLLIYVNEAFVQRSIPLFPQAAGPFTIATTTLIWMTFFPPKPKQE